MEYITHAPFHIGGRWVWLTWRSTSGNHLAAVDSKAREVGAAHWDASQADHEEVGRSRYWAAKS